MIALLSTTYPISVICEVVALPRSSYYYDAVERDVERDKIMSAVQAKEYGLIDEVITHRE